MNKLYVIRFLLSNGFCVSVWYAWDRVAALNKIAKNPEWVFEIQEDDDVHTIWNAH